MSWWVVIFFPLLYVFFYCNKTKIPFLLYVDRWQKTQEAKISQNINKETTGMSGIIEFRWECGGGGCDLAEWALKLTDFKLGCKAAAGDSQVVGVLLGVQQVHVRFPEFEVSAGAAGHKHLAAGREAAGHDTGLADRTASGNNNVRFISRLGLIMTRFTSKWGAGLYLE